MLIKAKFHKDGKPYGRSYTYQTDDDVKPGDIVVNDKETKLEVVDESGDEEWVKAYGESRIDVVRLYKPKEELEDDKL